MRKKLSAFAAAIITALSLTACGAPDLYDDSDDNSESVSSSDSVSISTEPLKVECHNIITENGKRTFDVDITCGNAFVVIYHYISSDNGRIENAIPSFKPLGMTDLKDILNDPQVGGSDLSESDFELVDGVYKMKDEELARSLLGSFASSYSFDQFWKNQKIAEVMDTEGISAEEAALKVEEMLENTGNNM